MPGAAAGFWPVTKSVLLFLGVPLVAGVLLRAVLLATAGRRWFEGARRAGVGGRGWRRQRAAGRRTQPCGAHAVRCITHTAHSVICSTHNVISCTHDTNSRDTDKFMPWFGPWALLGLLYTIIVMFAAQVWP